MALCASPELRPTSEVEPHALRICAYKIAAHQSRKTKKSAQLAACLNKSRQRVGWEGGVQDRSDRPRAIAVVELQGCRSRRSWGASTKKRVDLGSLCHIEHETAPPFVDAPQIRTVPKIKYDVSGRKPDQTRQKKKSGILGGRVDRSTTTRHGRTPRSTNAP